MNKLLKSKMVLNGDSLKTLSSALGITERSLWNKLHGITQFKKKEIKELQKIYSLTDAEVLTIFFK